jgi:hypothetical protein
MWRKMDLSQANKFSCSDGFLQYSLSSEGSPNGGGFSSSVSCLSTAAIAFSKNLGSRKTPIAWKARQRKDSDYGC